MSYQVKVLKAGYAYWLGPTRQRADGTVSLVRGQKNVIVDTGGPWDRDAIIEALRREKLSPKEIDFVVCTHGHSDHIGNNNLFPNATFIVSYDVSKGDLYTFHDFSSGQSYRIDNEIEVIPTKGHTQQDISVLVKTPSGMVAIVGDLFENEGDIENQDLWLSFSEFPEEQKASRAKILEMAAWIVPGHGNIFEVKKVRTKVRTFKKSAVRNEISIEQFLSQKSQVLSELATRFSTHVGRINVNKIKRWLIQFGDVERVELALQLLQHVDYVDDKMIGDMFREFWFALSESVKSKTLCTNIGGLKDSTSRVAYECSKAVTNENGVVPKFCEIRDAAKTRRPEDTCVIFVDDNIGSGNQSVQIFEEWLGVRKVTEIVQRLTDDEIEWLKRVKNTYFVVIGFAEGISKLKSRLKQHDILIKVHPCIPTKESYGCFQARSLIFPDSENRKKAKQMAAEIGYELLGDKEWAKDENLRRERSLGYGNSQKLIVFSYNTPTCTLPIFWKGGYYKRKKWFPLFPRRE